MKHRRRSSGFILAFVLICMTIVVLALMAMVQRFSLGQRQLIRRERQLQTQWLVEAGVDRATAKLRGDSQYTGELWQLPSDAMASQWPARVEIEVEPSHQADVKRVRVVAVYPDQGKLGIRDENEVLIQVASEAETQ